MLCRLHFKAESQCPFSNTVPNMEASISIYRGVEIKEESSMSMYRDVEIKEESSMSMYPDVEIKEESVVSDDWDESTQAKVMKSDLETTELDDEPVCPISGMRFSAVTIGSRNVSWRRQIGLEVTPGFRRTLRTMGVFSVKKEEQSPEQLKPSVVKKEALSGSPTTAIKKEEGVEDVKDVKIEIPWLEPRYKPMPEQPVADISDPGEFSKMLRAVWEFKPGLLKLLEYCSTKEKMFPPLWCLLKDEEIDTPFAGKSSVEAEKFRTLGHSAFSRGDYRRALEFFNLWISCAPGGNIKREPGEDGDQDSNICLAFANRSVIHLQNKNYTASLKDIQRAQDAGYPKSTEYKLWSRRGRAYLHLGRVCEALQCFDIVLKQVRSLMKERPDAVPTLRVTLKETMGAKRDCAKRLEKQRSSARDSAAICVEKATDDFQSSTPAARMVLSEKKRNLQFPALSSKVTVDLKLGTRFGSGRGIRAEENLSIGALVCREKPIVSVLFPSTISRNCYYCMRPLTSPIPCSRCTIVGFCDETCRDAACVEYHYSECPILECLLDDKLGASAHMVYRTLVKQPLDDWRVCQRRGENLPTFDEYEFEPPPLDSSDLATLFTLETHLKRRSAEEKLQATITAVFLVRLLHLGGYLRSPDEEKFSNTLYAGTLALRFLLAFSCNEVPINGRIVKNGTVEEEIFGLAIYPTVSFFNHSCNPSVHCTFAGNDIVMKCIQGVKKGSQVFMNYGFRFALNSRCERRMWLSRKYHFYCRCEACEENWPMAYELSLYKEVVRCFVCNKDFFPLFSMDICPSCKTDMSYPTKLMDQTLEKFLLVQERLSEGSPASTDRLFLEIYSRFVNKLMILPSATANFVTEVLCLHYGLDGNVNRIEG